MNLSFFRKFQKYIKHILINKLNSKGIVRHIDIFLKSLRTSVGSVGSSLGPCLTKSLIFKWQLEEKLLIVSWIGRYIACKIMKIG